MSHAVPGISNRTVGVAGASHHHHKSSVGGAATSKCIYARVSSADCPALDQQLGYILGKTLGSGTYAKVKAAWSKRHQNLVS